MNKIVLTGPTGAIGHALISLCLASGTEVFAICHPKSLRNNSIPQHKLVHVIEADLADLSGLVSVLPHNCDVFYHLGWAGCAAVFRNNLDVQAANIQYTLEAVRLAKACGCHTFIGAGSQAEYGRVEGKLRPDTPVFPEIGYGMAKLCAGQMGRMLAHQMGLKHVWARILSVYGPYDGPNTMIQSAIWALLNKQRISFTQGEQQWDYLYSKDAAAILLALGSANSVDGKVYCLGSGMAKPLKEYIEIIRDSIDSSLPIGIGDLPYNEKQIMYLCADTSDIINDLNYVYQYDFFVGIKETIDWCRQQR